MSDTKIKMVLEPEDEYPHEPDDSPNYNESMYLNAFEIERAVGGRFRLGNRVNEGYAEMTVCQSGIVVSGGEYHNLVDVEIDVLAREVLS